jgi:hypothetical protein
MLKVLLFTYSSLEECQLTRTAFGLSQGSPAQFTPTERHLSRLYAVVRIPSPNPQQYMENPACAIDTVVLCCSS